MSDATLEQRLAWLQNGLQQIGEMCLQLSRNGVETTGSPQVPDPRTQSQETDSSPAPVPTGVAVPDPPTGAILLSEFLEGVEDLTPSERLSVATSAFTMLDEVFVHLPLKRAMHGIDPLQRLRLLRQRLKSQIALSTVDLDARLFHDEMIEIFHSLRDLHTNYILPFSYQGKVAYLPFLAEEYFEGIPPRRHYLVTKLLAGFSHPTFQVGVTLTQWNGIPIDRAVELNAEREAGSNPDARHARGLEALTLRPMLLSAPPDEEWVIVGYVSGGQNREIRFDWRVMAPGPSASGALIDNPLAMTGDVARLMGFDAETESVRRAKTAIFFPDEIGKERFMAQVVANATPPSAVMAATTGSTWESQGPGLAAGADSQRQVKSTMQFPDIVTAHRYLNRAAAVGADAIVGHMAANLTGPVPGSPETTSLLPEFFRFRAVDTPSGTFGYIRISSFMTFDANAFAAEFVRLVKLLPQNGLILDVRGNGGGNINAGEQLLQVLTPNRIVPERFQFINTPTTLLLCQNDPSLQEWVSSIELAVQTGETYSQGFPLTSEPMANGGLGYHYPGKVVLVIDALCYSTTDIFAAGFQDHEIGKVLGTNGRTGAGGANVWTYNFFQNLNGFNPLPKGVNFRTAIRRSTRVGDRAGVPLEDLGVQPEATHLMTRRDLLESNVDLIHSAAQMLLN